MLAGVGSVSLLCFFAPAARVAPVRHVAAMAETAVGLPGLKKLALTQANAAAATIVETNALLDPTARQCVDCKPTQTALESQSKSLLPVELRARLARARLWGAKQMLVLLGKPEYVSALTLVIRSVRKLMVAYAAMTAVFILALTVPGVPTAAVAASDQVVGRKILRLPLLLFELELAWG